MPTLSASSTYRDVVVRVVIGMIRFDGVEAGVHELRQPLVPPTRTGVRDRRNPAAPRECAITSSGVRARSAERTPAGRG